MSIHLLFSNTIETLAASFISKVSESHDIFNPHTIIVPNPYLKKWLQLRIAESNTISVNHKFSFLSDGLWHTISSINGRSDIPKQLDHIDLQLLLYSALAGLTDNELRIKLLIDYLGPRDDSIQSDYAKKAWQLSSVLSRYFFEYEYYRQDMIQYWLNGRLVYNTAMESSQQYLYNQIFKKNGLRDTVDKNLLTLSQYWDQSINHLSPDTARILFLFAKSQLSPFHARILYELGKYITIYLFQVNPCSEFWEDVTTPGEDRWSQIRSIRIEEKADGATLAHNPNENYLLKLWGKAGRETIKLLSLLEEAGSCDMNVSSEWLSSPAEAPSDTCLHLVQNQILNRISATDSSGKVPQDCSIQIASCSDIFRETETVFNSILYNLKNDPDLAMSDIAIMVPDMSEYGPVINSIFSRHPKRITYSMIDSTAEVDSLFGKAVNTLIEIAEGSFTRKTVFDLFFNQCFLDAHDLNIEDARTFLTWADSLNIYHTFKKNDTVDPALNPYTWHQGLLRMRFGRILQPHGTSVHDGIFLDYRNIVPFVDMNTGNLKLIDSFSSIIELLFARTNKLHSMIASGREWASVIRSLVDEFIVIPSDRPEEEAVYHSLLNGIEKLSFLDMLSRTSKGSELPFSFIHEYIQQILGAISSRSGSYLSGGVNISALVPKRQLPFKIIYIMGMQEGMFPGMADTSTLNLMNVRRNIADTNRPDANRYLFLETLLSVREKLYITYIAKDLQKDRNYFPNSVLGQFLTYLNNYVIDKEFATINMPASGSSIDYLRIDPCILRYSDIIASQSLDDVEPVLYSFHDRLLLLRHAMNESHWDENITSRIKENIFSSIPNFSLNQKNAGTHTRTISLSLRDIMYFLNDPAESSLRWHLGIFEERDYDKYENDLEPFFSLYPNDYRFINNTLNYLLINDSKPIIEAYMNDYYRHVQLACEAPQGAYGEIDLVSFKNEIYERFYGSENLSTFINARKQLLCYHTLRFGTTAVSTKPDISLGPLIINVSYKNAPVAVHLSGHLPVLWKNPEQGTCETLILTNSEKPSVTHMIMPFLFYISASAGLDINLTRIFGTDPFTIHISTRSGISSYSCCLDQHTSARYLDQIIREFLDERSFDNIPLSVIRAHRAIQPRNMKQNPTDSDRFNYQQMLIRYIEEDRENNPFSQVKGVLDLMDPQVPLDAYDKVRDRLGILYTYFTG